MRNVRFIAVQVAVLLFTVYSVAVATNSRGVTEKFEKSYAISSGGTVSLENVNGDVKIATWDKNEVKVEAVKSADSKEALDELKIEVDASGDRVSINTLYPESEDGHRGNHESVDYVLTVPGNVNLDRIKTVNGKIEISGVGGDASVSTVNGEIKAEGLKGSCELKTVNGNLEADLSALSPGHEVEMKSVNGTVTIHLPDKADANIKASTTVGGISNDFGFETSRDAKEHSWVKVGDNLRGKLGNGGAKITLETVNGNIRILKLE